MKLIFLLLACFLVICEFTNNEMTKSHTIIGIYTHSLDSSPSKLQQKKTRVSHDKSYIPTSYVKYIQMSGARVIPLFAFSDKSYFDEILPKINGVLFPGGDMEINMNNKWTQNSNYILEYAMNQTKKGNPFPIWGICLGMQQLTYLTSGYDLKAISPVQGQLSVSNTLQIQPDNIIFKDMPTDLLKSLTQGVGILWFYHHFALTNDYYNSNTLLKNFWDVEAYTTTSFNQKFISVFKAKQYPFYGIQFHPEVPIFEWMMDADRQQHAIQIGQILCNKFVENARKNTNKLSSNQQLIKLSIFNYKTQKGSMNYLYVFNEPVVAKNLWQDPRQIKTK